MVVHPKHLSVHQGYFSTFKVTLDTKPPVGTEVTINAVSKSPSVIRILNGELIFTHSDYNEAQQVMVSEFNPPDFYRIHLHQACTFRCHLVSGWYIQTNCEKTVEDRTIFAKHIPFDGILLQQILGSIVKSATNYLYCVMDLFKIDAFVKVNAPLSPAFGFDISEVGPMSVEIDLNIYAGDDYYNQLTIPSLGATVLETPGRISIPMNSATPPIDSNEVCFNGPRDWEVCVRQGAAIPEPVELQVDEILVQNLTIIPRGTVIS